MEISEVRDRSSEDAHPLHVAFDEIALQSILLFVAQQQSIAFGTRDRDRLVVLDALGARLGEHPDAADPDAHGGMHHGRHQHWQQQRGAHDIPIFSLRTRGRSRMWSQKCSS